MLTLAEIESTLQIEYEWQLEALEEKVLRELLADARALGRLIPQHVSDAEGRSLAEEKLAALMASQPSGEGRAAPSEAGSA